MQRGKRRFAVARVEMPVAEPNEITVSESSGTYPASANLEVTLVVFGWQNVQPGTLSWVFPSFDAAMRAAAALRNATQWAILGGPDASGPVLAERSS
jgi:hypothetical protein